MFFKIDGLDAVKDKLAQMAADIGGQPLINTLQQCILAVERTAKLNLKPWKGPGTGGADTGRLRSSIMSEVRTSGVGFGRTIEGVTGTNVSYAPFQEHGTRPHYVSKQYIGKWAERHGLGFRGIFVSGTPLKYMYKALQSNLAFIVRKFIAFAETLVKK